MAYHLPGRAIILDRDKICKALVKCSAKFISSQLARTVKKCSALTRYETLWLNEYLLASLTRFTYVAAVLNLNRWPCSESMAAEASRVEIKRARSSAG